MSTVSSRASSLSKIAHRARDGFLLSGALKEVRGRPAARHELIRTYFDAAADLSAVADQLTDERGAVAALLLYREALPFLVTAVALSHDPDLPSIDEPLPAGASPWDVLADLHQRGRLKALPPKLEQARAALATKDALELGRLPPQTRLDRRAVVQATVRHLSGLIEPRTPIEIVGSRYLHIAAVLGVVALAICGVWIALRHPNLALHKPAGASSRHPNSTAPVDSSGLDNGVIEPTYGIETAPGPGWAGIDLLEDVTVTTVKIFNRRDALFDAGLPLILETSSDGANFTVAERRTQPFSAAHPWIYTPPADTHFRFLRVRSNSLVALTEIEVY